MISLCYFQKEVYDKTCRVLIPDVINGYNATVFAYGATGNVADFQHIHITNNDWAMWCKVLFLLKRIKTTQLSFWHGS